MEVPGQEALKINYLRRRADRALRQGAILPGRGFPAAHRASGRE